ncbi:MAG: SDR family NAD(P)-dependent oxidoreductase [Acidobacteria bacterium]|nr:SDR family NAD(P)-dependent oxidoreductase [Acidobacteriota bacterium]MBV9476874.1 SDR family NAD(P)-dependent oxidoreductase [Acidobacteriota bacterium]
MNAVLTGASSGIGHALARELARRGYAVALLARREALLDALARDINARGGRALPIACDVTDRASVHDAVARAERDLGPIDLAVANAGVSVPNSAATFSLADAELIMNVNYHGMLYLYDAVIRSMMERRTGTFAGVASLAGLRGLPGAGSYSASKAAMQNFLEAARVELRPYGVRVAIVNPGFVATPMTEKNRFRMPFLMNADDAALAIANGLAKGKRVIEFPRPMSLLVRLLRVLPDALFDRATVPYARRRLDRDKVKR